MYSLNEEFSGKTIIVTGGNKGIGKGCAEVFCDVGANVVICGRNIEDGLRTEKEINSRDGGECVFFKCDVGTESEVKALVDFTVDRYGKLDCLVNNAGYYPRRRE